MASRAFGAALLALSISLPIRGAELVLQENNLKLGDDVVSTEYDATAVTLRRSQPDAQFRSSALYIGTHEAGGEQQVNRALFAFDLDPVREILRSGAGGVKAVSLVLTTASGNEYFPRGMSTFEALLSAPFDPEEATWNNPGYDHPAGGAAYERLSTAALDSLIATKAGEQLTFASKDWTIAFRDAIHSSQEQFVVMVRRVAEDGSRVRGYFFRPADDSFRHSSGAIDWRPALVVELE